MTIGTTRINKNNPVRVDGLDLVADLIGNVSVREGRKANANTVYAMAALITKGAKRNVIPFSRTGTLRRALHTKRGRARNPDRPFSDVKVSVGRGAKYDAWYWRFVEFGTDAARGHHATGEKPFIRPARDEVASDYVNIYRKMFLLKVAQQLKKRRR